jgi:putative transposase
LARSSLYYQPVSEDPEDLRLKGLIDEEFTRHPFYGRRRITAWLNLDRGETVNEKRVWRLMREMGLVAIYPKPRLSAPGAGHRIHPYLLRGVAIARPNQVWATDITYIRLARGFVYLVAVMDWFSRYVISWRLSTTLDTAFCLEALEEAFEQRAPEIFNSDQGSQFTSEDFTNRLTVSNVRISMDGRGRAHDNIFVERLWRSVKYEEVYPAQYMDVADARSGLARYFRFYNNERRHQSLERRTPAEVYLGRETVVKIAA